MSIALSKPLFTCLCLSVVATITVKLAPEQAKAPDVELLVDARPRADVRVDALISKGSFLEGEISSGDLSKGFIPYRPPPPRVEPPAPVAQKPVAPSPHFTYMGRMSEGKEVLAFIGAGENVEVISIGAQVDYNWRLDEITDSGVVLTYLPLNEQRHISASER